MDTSHCADGTAERVKVKLRQATALLIGALALGRAAEAHAQLAVPGSRPVCTTPGVPAGCAPAEIEPQRAPNAPQVPVPSATADAANKATATGVIPPPRTGDEEMEKPAPPTGPNATPVITPEP